MNIIRTLFFSLCSFACCAQNSLHVAVLKYNGGGDYYANPTALPNLVRFCNSNLKTGLNEKDIPYVEAGSKAIFDYPFVHMTGHGNVVFSKLEIENLSQCSL